MSERRGGAVADWIAFTGIRSMHEWLYSTFRDADRTLGDAGVEEGMRVLEVGCGPGFFTVPAARLVGPTGSVCSIDLNRYAVEHVQCKVARLGASNVEVRLLDASATTFEQASFDLVLLLGMRRAIGGLDAILREAHRVLRPQGVLAVEGPLVRSFDSFLLREQRRRIWVYVRRDAPTP